MVFVAYCDVNDYESGPCVIGIGATKEIADRIIIEHKIKDIVSAWRRKLVFEARNAVVAPTPTPIAPFEASREAKPKREHGPKATKEQQQEHVARKQAWEAAVDKWETEVYLPWESELRALKDAAEKAAMLIPVDIDFNSLGHLDGWRQQDHYTYFVEEMDVRERI